MNTIIFGEFREKKIYEDIYSAYPNFLFDEFKLVFEDEFYGKIETIVKICEPTIENGENDYLEYPHYRGIVRLIDYSDKYHETDTYEMEYYSDDGLDFVYVCCGGDNYDRGYAVDIIMREILSLIDKRERVQKNIKSAKFIRKNEILPKKQVPNNKIFLLNDICEYFYMGENQKSGNHTITCPCWGVRGHYRHYKNGNVVFVKSYEKGKEKGKTKPKNKVYTI